MIGPLGEARRGYLEEAERLPQVATVAVEEWLRARGPGGGGARPPTGGEGRSPSGGVVAVRLDPAREAYLQAVVDGPFVVVEGVKEWAEKIASRGFSARPLLVLGVDPQRVGFMGPRVVDAVIGAAQSAGLFQLYLEKKEGKPTPAFVVVAPPEEPGMDFRVRIVR